MLPSRRKKQKAPKPGRVNKSHQQWVRGFHCCVPGCRYDSPVQFAHVRSGIDNPDERGGMGIKPSDAWGIPLCAAHHMEQHRRGESSFDDTYKINRVALAKEFAAKSPHLKKMETGK